MKKRYLLLIVFLLVFIFACFVGFKTFGKNGNGKIKIFKNNTIEYKAYRQGDKVEINNDSWYVMYDSSSKDDYVTLISSNILFLNDDEITDVIMGIYETSDLNNYLKNVYAKSLGIDNLVERNGYTVRLFNEDDMKSLLKVNYNKAEDSYEIEECPEFVCVLNEFYATMIDTRDISFNGVYENLSDFNEDEEESRQLHLKYYNVNGTYDSCELQSIVNDSTLFVRPVINIKKSAIE